MIATLSADGRTVEMRKGDWSMTCPAEDMPRWLAFYRSLWGRGARKPGEPGPHAASYEGAIKSLERVEKMIRLMGAR